MYLLSSGNSLLAHPSAGLRSLGPAQVSQSVLRGDLHYLLLTQSGHLKLFNQRTEEVVSLPASASLLAHKPFKNIRSGQLDGRCQVLQALEGREVFIVGPLMDKKGTTSLPQQLQDQRQAIAKNNGDNQPNNQGQTFKDCFTKFDRIKFQLKIKSVAVGFNHVLALSELQQGGKVFSWGRGHLGQLGHEDTEDQAFPKHIKSLCNYVHEV